VYTRAIGGNQAVSVARDNLRPKCFLPDRNFRLPGGANFICRIRPLSGETRRTATSRTPRQSRLTSVAQPA